MRTTKPMKLRRGAKAPGFPNPALARQALVLQPLRRASAIATVARSVALAVKRALCGFGAALLVTGCAQFIIPTPPPSDPSGAFMPLTKPIIAVGDTQEHEPTGFPTHDNDGAVDAYVEVAQRPPGQPLFGRRILEWVLVHHPSEPVIHLGDLLDMSCRSEIDRMRAVFSAATQPSAILPGNHDGLMFGIFNHPVVGKVLESAGHGWYRACVRGAREDGDVTRLNPRDAVVDKREFITTYLNFLSSGPRPIDGLAPPPAAGDARISWRSRNPDGFLEAIEANLFDGHGYANSFIAQKLRLPAAAGAARRVVVIGLDTNQVDALVGTLDALRSISPGDIGHIRADQLEAIAPWVDEARRAGDIIVFAGHHNWNRLSFGSQARLGAVMAKLDHPLVYISAHTHTGYWASHRLGQRSLLELNVSSLSDWPIAYRRIQFAVDEEAKRLKVTAEIMPHLGAPPRDDEDLLRAWESTVCANTGYTASKIEREVLDIVRLQKESRGSLFEWLYEGVGEWCQPCLQSLYESGMRYQDAMLEAIDQFYRDFADEAAEVRTLRPPASCGERPVSACIAALREARPEDLDATIRLFKEKAQFVDVINRQFDGLKDSRLRAYMTCRAVVSARIDYDLTPDDRRTGRGEGNRRALDFFRTEATVGMD